jgi:chromosome segregation protein
MGSLRFLSIKLVGFKSFVEPTTFLIEPGLTGIVGPNGCGKSNLLEAIRWVMGANSAKAMRASGMDDVIFSGTKTRPARGQASVTLKIDNKARVAPAMFNDDEDLEITRIITKGSGSKYKVNGKTVRAKDVQLLFADASTGANSPALVRQGQINELISAKPQNRRRILEEAAGISGLYTRRHEAELRLRAAETNLDRLEDVLGQIESQLLSLRRQSRQASRFKRLAGDIRQLKALLWLKRWQAALLTLEENTEALKNAEAVVVDLTAKVAALSAQTADITTQLEPQREEQIVAAAVCGRLNAAKEALEKDADMAKSEIKKLEDRLAFLVGDIEREDGITIDAKSADAKLTQELGTLASSENNASAVETAKAKAETTATARNVLETRTNDLTRTSAEQAAQLSNAKRTVDELENQSIRMQRDVQTAQSSLDDLNTAHASAMSEQSLFSTSFSDAGEKLEQARAAETQALGDKQEAETAEREARDILTNAKQDYHQAQAEQRALSNIVTGAQKNAKWVPVLGTVSVKTGYEAALAAALGEDLDAGLEAEAPLRWSGAEIPNAALPKGATTLNDFVMAPDALKARLSQIGIVDKSAGNALAKQLLPGQRLVSKEGDLWRWDGFYAADDLPSTAAVKLENINRLYEIEESLIELTRTLEDANARWEDVRNTRERTDKIAREARQILPALEREERSAQAAVSRFETDQARKAEQKTAAQNRLSRLQQELKGTQSRLETAQETLAGTATNDKLEADLQSLRTELEQAREVANDASAEYRSLRNAEEARAQRLRSVEQDIADWRKRAEQAKDRIALLEGRKAETELALRAAQDSPDEFTKRQQRLLSELTVAEARRSKAGDILAQTETALREADAHLRRTEHELGTARETRAANEARNVAAHERKDEIEARIQETLNCTPGELPEQLGELTADNKMPEHDIERKLERLTRERENMGGVNLRADEEAAEQEERLTALNDERQDLVAAIARLRQGIDNLNTEGRERLLEAFETVNKHFGQLFVTLFGGGHASLALTESDDPLEAGLDVLVSPPGKKLGSMSLMSGGEQALTATALIFAVFLSNPAPICVLDEVDAPLDDANVARYCDLLDEMCKKTQTKFIAITHNPVTMSRMDRIFGVTMAEKGISQLVSIDLGEAEKLTVNA